MLKRVQGEEPRADKGSNPELQGEEDLTNKDDDEIAKKDLADGRKVLY
ncbi:MAG TPA: hypothetical protein VHH33_00930 [Nitrososphaeraceae archaeon]|nr:hypothetical protein [Nitrososphaeraceae archaeon]